MPNFNLLQAINSPQIIGQLPMTSNQGFNGEDSFLGALGGLGKLLGLGGTQPRANANPNPMSPQMGLNQGALAGIGLNPSKQLMQDPQTRAINNNLKGYDLANSMIGLNEVKDNGTLHAFLQKGGANIDPANTPWCAGFANSVLASSGLKGTGSLAARSFLNYGTPTQSPTKGDLVVFSDLTGKNDPNHGHVGFYAGTDQNGNVLVLGGNQGNGVSIKAFPSQKVLGYRQPPTGQQIQQAVLPKNPNPELGHVMQGISYVESGGDYNSISKPARNGTRSYGKYQISESNIPSWSTEALGHPMTRQQFLSNPQAQEQIASYHLNKLLQQGYSPQDVASIWFSGRPQNKAGNAKDTYGTTVPQYVNKFNKGYLQSKSGIGPLSMLEKEVPVGKDTHINPPTINSDDYNAVVNSLDKGKSYE